MFSVIRLKAGTIHPANSKICNLVGFFVADAGTMLMIKRSEAAEIITNARKHATQYPLTHQMPKRTVY